MHFGWVELASGDAAYFVYDIASHGIYFVIVLEISGCESASALFADIDAVEAGYFLGQGMGGLAGMKAVGAGAVDLPGEAFGLSLVLKDAFGQGAAADVSETDHQKSQGFLGPDRVGRRLRMRKSSIPLLRITDFHGRKGTELGGRGLGGEGICVFEKK